MIPLYRPSLHGREKEYVDQCLDSTWISSKGEFIQRFENAFAAHLGVKAATSVCNGTVAIHLALAALGIGPGDEVVVPTFTYVASVNPIVHLGATPVFVDSHPDTWQMDPAEVERRITPRTKALMVVHLYGQPCDMGALGTIKERHGLKMVEDCAESFGAAHGGRLTGSFGDLSAFSFFGNKTITTGEGGMVVSNDPVLLEKAYRLKTQGVSPDREYWHEVVGYNYRMTNLCAAIGLAQLERAGEILAKKREIAGWYRAGLAGTPVELQPEGPGSVPSHWLCNILLKRAEARDGLRAHLKEAGIETRPFFHPVHTLPPYAKGEVFPVAESLSARGISLPSYPDLSREEVAEVCSAIRSYFP